VQGLIMIVQVALETEVDNVPSLRIYENLGFIRTKRLHRYYLNGNTAFRLLLYLKPGVAYKPTYPPEYLSNEGGYDPSGQVQGQSLMSEDLLVRQAAQLEIEDVQNERFTIVG
jgi:N-alpha-acetyltransferase 30